MAQKDYTTTKLSKLKKGDIFRMEGGRKVYVYRGKIRMYSRWGEYKGWGYEYSAWDDISDYKETFSDKKVEIDFDF